jgi:hypothetical protein
MRVVVRGLTPADHASTQTIHLRRLRAANREWEQLHERPEPAVFQGEILALLVRVPLQQFQTATELSPILASEIKVTP